MPGDRNQSVECKIKKGMGGEGGDSGPGSEGRCLQNPSHRAVQGCVGRDLPAGLHTELPIPVPCACRWELETCIH